MKYRIKAYHYKNYSRYIPQWRFLWFWNNFDDRIFGCIDFGSKIKAQKFLDDYIDKSNPKIENIPYERTN
jgi:hypothetical protein